MNCNNKGASSKILKESGNYYVSKINFTFNLFLSPTDSLFLKVSQQYWNFDIPLGILQISFQI